MTILFHGAQDGVGDVIEKDYFSPLCMILATYAVFIYDDNNLLLLL